MGLKEAGNKYKGENVPRRRKAAVGTKRGSSTCMVWVPAVPSWEKKFCYKIGQFTWENFLEAKKYTKYDSKIMDWNDSAAKEAFHCAKDRFFAQINGSFSTPNDDRVSSMSNANLYIDEIDWDKEVCPEVLHELESTRLNSDDDSEEEISKKFPIEKIEPTGWDVDIEEFSRGRILTGLIVGY